MSRRNLKQEHQRRRNHRALLRRNDNRHRAGAGQPKWPVRKAGR